MWWCGCSQITTHPCILIRYFNNRNFSKHLVRLPCQSCRSLSRQKRCPGCTTRRWIYFAPDCPRRKAVVEFRLCVGHDCLGTHLHRIGIRPNPYCMLCSLHETVDRNHLRRRTALCSGTECERYWEARTKMMEIWLFLSISVTTPYY